MSDDTTRQTVDLSANPDLIVVYLGMRVKSLRGMKTLVKFGQQASDVLDDDPDGLLHHERIYFSFLPPHVGMRQYWRDFEALENWARSSPHAEWWEEFVTDPRGTAFWHEAYALRGVDAIYDYVDSPLGMMNCLPVRPASGDFYSARERIGAEGEPTRPTAVPEDELRASESEY